MKTAIVHDWLVTAGGAEKALESIHRVFPAPVHTLVFDPKTADAVLGVGEVRASWLQRLPLATSLYRNFLPFYPSAVGSLDVSGAELVISSSHAVAKSVPVRPGQLHISYCYTPMRYAWDLHEQYMASLDPVRRLVARGVLAKLKAWDKATAAGVDHFVGISHHVADRITRCYGRPADVIYPPVDTDYFKLETRSEDYFVTCSRMVPYKKMDLIAETFSALGLPLYIIGDGPDAAKVAAKSYGNVRLMGALPRDEVRRLIGHARAFIFAAEEDFGIAPVEAMACGTPVIGYGKGALLETVADGEHGVLFREQSVASLADAVSRFERIERSLDMRDIRKNAERFSRERFETEFKEYVEQKWAAHTGAAVEREAVLA